MSRHRDRITKANRANERSREWHQEKRMTWTATKLLYNRDTDYGRLPENLKLAVERESRKPPVKKLPRPKGARRRNGSIVKCGRCGRGFWASEQGSFPSELRQVRTAEGVRYWCQRCRSEQERPRETLDAVEPRRSLHTDTMESRTDDDDRWRREFWRETERLRSGPASDYLNHPPPAQRAVTRATGEMRRSRATRTTRAQFADPDWYFIRLRSWWRKWWRVRFGMLHAPRWPSRRDPQREYADRAVPLPCAHELLTGAASADFTKGC